MLLRLFFSRPCLDVNELHRLQQAFHGDSLRGRRSFASRARMPSSASERCTAPSPVQRRRSQLRRAAQRSQTKALQRLLHLLISFPRGAPQQLQRCAPPLSPLRRSLGRGQARRVLLGWPPMLAGPGAPLSLLGWQSWPSGRTRCSLGRSSRRSSRRCVSLCLFDGRRQQHIASKNALPPRTCCLAAAARRDVSAIGNDLWSCASSQAGRPRARGTQDRAETQHAAGGGPHAAAVRRQTSPGPPQGCAHGWPLGERRCGFGAAAVTKSKHNLRCRSCCRRRCVYIVLTPTRV